MFKWKKKLPIPLPDITPSTYSHVIIIPIIFDVRNGY